MASMIIFCRTPTVLLKRTKKQKLEFTKTGRLTKVIYIPVQGKKF
jgi:hypothetical protein